MKLLIHSQISTVAELKFGNDKWFNPHFLWWIYIYLYVCRIYLLELFYFQSFINHQSCVLMTDSGMLEDHRCSAQKAYICSYTNHGESCFFTTCIPLSVYPRLSVYPCLCVRHVCVSLVTFLNKFAVILCQVSLIHGHLCIVYMVIRVMGWWKLCFLLPNYLTHTNSSAGMRTHWGERGKLGTLLRDGP